MSKATELIEKYGGILEATTYSKESIIKALKDELSYNDRGVKSIIHAIGDKKEYSRSDLLTGFKRMDIKNILIPLLKALGEEV